VRPQFRQRRQTRVPNDVISSSCPVKQQHRRCQSDVAIGSPAINPPASRRRGSRDGHAKGREALLRQGVIDNVESSGRPVKGFRRAAA
jgi:hypothetical protein